jgi:hypothetical protein
MHTQEKLQENRVRRMAGRAGYIVRRSRQWKHVPNLDNHGDYMLVDADSNFAVLGFRFDATLDDIADWLAPGHYERSNTNADLEDRT